MNNNSSVALLVWTIIRSKYEASVKPIYNSNMEGQQQMQKDVEKNQMRNGTVFNAKANPYIVKSCWLLQLFNPYKI
jgi:hypothetical protein